MATRLQLIHTSNGSPFATSSSATFASAACIIACRRLWIGDRDELSEAENCVIDVGREDEGTRSDVEVDEYASNLDWNSSEGRRSSLDDTVEQRSQQQTGSPPPSPEPSLASRSLASTSSTDNRCSRRLRAANCLQRPQMNVTVNCFPSVVSHFKATTTPHRRQ